VRRGLLRLLRPGQPDGRHYRGERVTGLERRPAPFFFRSCFGGSGGHPGPVLAVTACRARARDLAIVTPPARAHWMPSVIKHWNIDRPDPR
jgi:hypothetical protein